eukprot:scaffold123054_cov36-Phaeocystis_antarctica.AAC.1
MLGAAASLAGPQSWLRSCSKPPDPSLGPQCPAGAMGEWGSPHALRPTTPLDPAGGEGWGGCPPREDAAR